MAAGDELRLNPAVLSSDIADFEQAVASDDREQAAALYAGPLLDGVHLVDGSEFERWLDGERARLGRAYAEVLDGLAQAAEERGETAEAVAWWQRLAAHDPFSSRVAMRLMQSLAALGDSAAAIRHAAVHAALLREELGAEPAPGVKKLAEQLKAAPVEPARAPAVPPARTESADVVATVPDPPSDAPRAPDVVAVPAPPAVIDEKRRRVPVALWTALVIVVAIVIGAVAVWRRPPARPAPAASIAVLPFTDLSPARDNAYFSDGITEELINTLARVEGVRVAARTSVFAYKDRRTDVRDVGRELGVATVLEGSVRKAGDKLRITARLANAADGYQLWSESYDRELHDVFSIQEDISRAIVGTLRGRLTASTPVRIAEQSTNDAGAYDLYLKGRYAWHERTEGGLHRAVKHFGDAAALAPSYARAYVGLGDAYAVLGFYDYLAPRASFPKAEEAARRALALDSSLAAPYATLGYVALYHHWNWTRAEELFRRSIALDPSYSTARQWYGNLLMARGRFDEAEREMRSAQERDPLSLIANAALGWIFYHAGDLERAIEQCNHTLELDRDFQLAHLWKGWALEAADKPREAISSISEAVRLSGGAMLPRLSLAHALANAGDRDSATAILTSAEKKAAHDYVPSYEVAKVHLALGHTDDAMRWLERAFAERSHSMAFLAVDPQLRPLRADARFQRLAARVNEPSRSP
jgi:TolB-like protein/Tfp pilus assembly protein PilF